MPDAAGDKKIGHFLWFFCESCWTAGAAVEEAKGKKWPQHCNQPMTRIGWFDTYDVESWKGQE